jgi:hypothetical protein
MGVFSKYPDEKAQGFETAKTVEKFKQIFAKRQKEGYVLTDMAEGW